MSSPYSKRRRHFSDILSCGSPEIGIYSLKVGVNFNSSYFIINCKPTDTVADLKKYIKIRTGKFRKFFCCLLPGAESDTMLNVTLFFLIFLGK